jgi:hypothetical protein
MKLHHILMLMIVCLALTKCKNEIVKPEDPAARGTRLILGKWDLVKDSTASRFLDTVLHINEYAGSTDDYYDFRDDGKCYIKENGVYRTLAYKMTGDNSAMFGNINYSSSVDPLTNHSATINFAFPMGPGGGYRSQTVYLKK